MLAPKAEELIAAPYRFGGDKSKAEEHFLGGFEQSLPPHAGARTSQLSDDYLLRL